jgi:hypothetical protein
VLSNEQLQLFVVSRTAVPTPELFGKQEGLTEFVGLFTLGTKDLLI